MPRRPDLLVIGGGLAGLALALEAARRKARVVLLEKGEPGREASWAGAGILTPREFASGRDPGLPLVLEGRPLFGPAAEELRAETGIDVELRETGVLELLFDGKDERSARSFLRRDRALAGQFRLLDPDEVRRLEPRAGRGVRGGVLYPAGGQVRNNRLARALAARARQLGVEIRTGVEASGAALRRGRALGARVGGRTISAGDTVVAAGAWSGLLSLSRPLPVEPARGQIVLVEGPPGLLRHVVYWREFYAVPRADGRILLGSTVEFAGFERRVTARGASGILAACLKMIPALAPLPVAASWCGFRPASPDGQPILGRIPGAKNLWAATGHFRRGIMLSLVTGRKMADAILDGNEGPLAPFSPARFNGSGG